MEISWIIYFVDDAHDYAIAEFGSYEHAEAWLCKHYPQEKAYIVKRCI